MSTGGGLHGMTRRIRIAALEKAVMLLHWIAGLMSDKAAAEWRHTADVLADFAKDLREEERRERTADDR